MPHISENEVEKKELIAMNRSQFIDEATKYFNEPFDTLNALDAWDFLAINGYVIVKAFK